MVNRMVPTGWVFGKLELVECYFEEWYYLDCKTCVKKVITLDDNMFRCDFSIKNYSYSVKRFRFVGNIVDYTSNASLLLWDREVVQLTGKKVTDVVGSTTEISNGLHS
ncbi:uncharacterized protein LOC121751609 [Salvia splendens]|uniref:uncharacterized protein LOC121751609 n=1 Tax=Salvia splendens TaxID=180675 RepID=UPI001C25FE76|nr:uncharacterized protein LOC121751609 [Salvia splendens]